MRLLNVKTLRLEQFEELNVPPYAILSHRWEDGELLYADVQGGIKQYKQGFSKVRWTCEQASQDGLQYTWIDTCCIDKSSSTELSEAINSMFNWYKRAHVCYVYLSDVHENTEGSTGADAFVNTFSESLWFSRGWTLQELIAPRQMKFFSHKWHLIGTRDEFQHIISNVTRIDAQLLMKDREPLQVSLKRFSTAQKMSWAANRRTTRVEDRAYSLLGLFEVNMPLLYGEGQRAFVRLQEEILKDSTDLSILAWEHNDHMRTGKRELLASTPNDFAGCHNIIYSPIVDDTSTGNTQYELRSSGLRIAKPRMGYVFEHGLPHGAWVVSLDCRKDDDILGVLALKLEPLEPVVFPKAPIHSSKTSTFVERRAELSKPTFTVSSREVPCYVAWNIDSEPFSSRNQRIVCINVLELATSPGWESLILLRQFAVPEARHHLVPPVHTHVWLRPPDDGRRPPWKVLDLWPRKSWNTKNLTFDLGRAKSSGHAMEEGHLQGCVQAMILLSDPLMGFRITVYIAQWPPGWDGVRVDIRKHVRGKFTHRQVPLYDGSSNFLDVTEHLRVKAAVRDIKRAGLRIAQVILTVEYREQYTDTERKFDNTPQELTGSVVDTTFFEKQIKVGGARDQTKEKAINAQNLKDPDGYLVRYAELQKMEEDERAAKKAAVENAKKVSDMAVLRWATGQMY